MSDSVDLIPFRDALEAISDGELRELWSAALADDESCPKPSNVTYANWVIYRRRLGTIEINKTIRYVAMTRANRPDAS